MDIEELGSAADDEDRRRGGLAAGTALVAVGVPVLVAVVVAVLVAVAVAVLAAALAAAALLGASG